MKKEVFIPFSGTGDIHLLGLTLDDWDTSKYEPVAIKVKDPSNAHFCRIAAETIAKADYLIAKLGTKPGDSLGVKKIKKGQGIRVEACQPRIQ